MRTLSSLIGRTVETPSGLKLGRCHDIKAELTENQLEIVALCVGGEGYLARLGIRSRPHNEIEWSSIIRIEGRRIVVPDPHDSDRKENPPSST